MNERIKELWVEGTQTTVPREGDYSSVSAKNIEKFAELIIRAAHEVIVVGGVDDVDSVLEHFGVSE